MAPPRIVAIVGPTAGGKTALAVEVASRLGAEIVSVDSRQVYRRLDVGTAKPDPAQRAAVVHHMIDVVEPDEPFDAAAFAIRARAAIDSAHRRARPVLLCGGSGLYLRALTEGLCPAPPASPAERAALRAELAQRGAPALRGELERVDPVAAGRIAPRDHSRLLRALEVARSTGRPLSDWQREHGFRDRPYTVRSLVLAPPVEVLDRRVAERARDMWAGGLVAETAAVLEAGFDPDLPPLCAIGYREAQAHLRGELAAADAIDAITLATRRYAKRQRTWFRGLSGARWLDGSEPVGAVLHEVESFVQEGGDAAHVS